MKYILGLIGIVLGIAAGLMFPDVDESIALVEHRSILTHGPLVPLVFFIAASRRDSVPVRWLAVGVCLGVAAHLGFHLFPEAWSGHALISVYGYGRTPMAFSWAWIAFSMTACVYMAARLTDNRREDLLLLAGLAGAFWWIAREEPDPWWPATAIAAATAVALIAAPSKSRSSGGD